MVGVAQLARKIKRRRKNRFIGGDYITFKF
jgi:hypothetical protein